MMCDSRSIKRKNDCKYVVFKGKCYAVIDEYEAYFGRGFREYYLLEPVNSDDCYWLRFEVLKEWTTVATKNEYPELYI